MKNQLTVDCLCSLAKMKMQELIDYEKSLRKSLKSYPNASLKIGKSHGNVQYFESSNKKDSYIPKRKREYAATLARKDYEQDMLFETGKLITSLKEFLLMYKPDRLIGAYKNLHQGRKILFEPDLLPQEDFVERWKSVIYEGLTIEKDSLNLNTSCGVTVRSKSEVIIVEKLTSMGIPFRYEYPCKLKNGLCLYPDFTCLNVRTRKEILWEHFGKMDDLEYVGRTVQKIRTYQLNGFYEGESLICTFEKEGLPMTPAYAECFARKYLL